MLSCNRMPTSVGKSGQGRAGQGRAGQGRAGQGRAGQGRAGTRQAQCVVQGGCMHEMPILVCRKHVLSRIRAPMHNQRCRLLWAAMLCRAACMHPQAHLAHGHYHV
jgi:hypothetical protein